MLPVILRISTSSCGPCRASIAAPSSTHDHVGVRVRGGEDQRLAGVGRVDVGSASCSQTTRVNSDSVTTRRLKLSTSKAEIVRRGREVDRAGERIEQRQGIRPLC